ncbi:MAG: hypothetical protein J5506_05535 [Prevotella sp.]|nr:hypothetical protein [Prevotella sp.]
MFKDYLTALLATIILAACTTPAQHRRAQFTRVLDHAQEQNLAYDSITNVDSIRMAVNFFNRHGSANEQMRASYLMGCAYRDTGDAPRALENYQNAAERADTTSRDCDFFRLSCVFSQMAGIYHKQLLLSNEIKAREKAAYYAMRTDSIYYGIYDLDMSAAAYIMKGRNDSAQIILEKVQKLYGENGFEQEKLRSSRVLIYLYAQQKDRLGDARRLINEFDSKSDMFDKNHELPPSKRLYNYYKGLYFESVGSLDSAEFYYRKSYRPNRPVSDQEPTYRGLLSVYKKRHQADSIANYAELYCEANDSSVAKKDRELMAQMTASYNYSRFQKQAFEKEREAHDTKLIMLGVTALLLLLLLVFWYQYSQYKARKRQELMDIRNEYAFATDEYQKNTHMMEMLDRSHRAVIKTVQNELKGALAENLSYKDELAKVTQAFNTLNEEFENSKKELTEENAQLEKRIKAIKKKKALTMAKGKDLSFFETKIVRDIRICLGNPLSCLTFENKELLLATAREYYPDLMDDLDGTIVNSQEKLTCILVVLNLRGTECANLLKVSVQRITNIKQLLNMELFGENTARTLYKNLMRKYDICPV